jgi:hypothetical protein
MGKYPTGYHNKLDLLSLSIFDIEYLRFRFRLKFKKTSMKFSNGSLKSVTGIKKKLFID